MFGFQWSKLFWQYSPLPHQQYCSYWHLCTSLIAVLQQSLLLEVLVLSSQEDRRPPPA
jgi:hypothetical protein